MLNTKEKASREERRKKDAIEEFCGQLFCVHLPVCEYTRRCKCGVLKILPFACTYAWSQPCGSSVHFACAVCIVECLRRGKVNKSEKEGNEKEPRTRFVGDALQVAELHPIGTGCWKCRFLGGSIVLHCNVHSHRPMEWFGSWNRCKSSTS